MKEIKINTDSRDYPVLVGTDILTENYLKEFSNKTSVNVYKIT